MGWALLALLLLAALVLAARRWLRMRHDVRTFTDFGDWVYVRLVTFRLPRSFNSFHLPRALKSPKLPRRADLRRRVRSWRESFSWRHLTNPTLPPFNRRWLGLAALALALVGIGVWRGVTLFRPAPPPDSAFVVRVAPFNTPDGDERQGRAVAKQLADTLRSQVAGPADLQTLNIPVADAQTAMAVAQAQHIDVLIWGSAPSGATGDPRLVRPQMVWLPGVPWVPATWPGAAGRFAIAPTYDLTNEPVDGTLVLPLVVNSIAHLSRGEVDQAATPAETLLRQGPSVRVELPATVLLLADWALHVPRDGEAHARAALQGVGRAEHWNNLGVVLHDNGQAAAAEDAFRQAIGLAPQFAVAHANLARVLLLAQGRTEDALVEARTAVQLAPTDAPAHATLGAAQRANGYLGAARTTFDALAQNNNDVLARADRAVLDLTDVVTASGRLEWELDGPPTRTTTEIAKVHDAIAAAVADTQQRRTQWLQQSNSAGVGGRIVPQRVAEQAAARLEGEEVARRYDLLLADIEAGKREAAQPRSVWARLWDGLRGKRTLLQTAQATAAALRARAPERAYDLLCVEAWAAYAGDDRAAAQTAWDAAQTLAAAAQPGDPAFGRPDARYGQALLALAANNRAEARQRFNAALAADARFFPAHQQLAAMAEQDAAWADAEAHYRWLTEQRPWDAAGALGLARALRAQNRLAEAEQQLLPLANARNADALILLGTIYRSANRLDEAERVLAEATKLAPQRPDLHEERANVALNRGDWHAAEAELQQTLKLDGNRTSARVALGQLYVERLGQPAAAVDQLQRAVRVEPTNNNAQRWLGQALLGTNRANAAVAAFDQALKQAPNDVAARHGLAQAQLALKDVDAAAQNEQAALDGSNNTFVPALIGLGELLERQQRWPEAQERYATALRHDPIATGAYLGLARIAAARGDAQTAIEYYRRGLHAVPNDVRLLVALGDQLAQTNATDEAIKVLKQAQAAAPNDSSVHRGLGRALWQAQQGDAALAELDQALKLNPTDADTLLLVGDIRAALGRVDAARDAYNAAARARPTWYDPHYHQGVLLLQQGETASAIKELERSMALNGDVSEGAYWLGRAYRAANRAADAERMFRRAIELRREYYEARFYLAQTLAEQGRGAEARTVYQTILVDAPPTDQWRVQAQQALGR